MKIHKVKPDITWSEFKLKFEKKFKVSNEAKRLELVMAEFIRLTGRYPKEDGKVKRIEQPIVKVDTGSDGEESFRFGKGSRKRSDKSEHGSTLSGKGFFWKETT